MALFNVIIDQTRVSLLAVETLAKVFEEHIEEHHAETHADDCHSSFRRRATWRLGRHFSCRKIVRHSKSSFSKRIISKAVICSRASENKLKITGDGDSVISTNQARRGSLHWSRAACNRIRSSPRRLF